METIPNPLLHKPVKLLEYNTGENLDNLGYGDDFLDITLKP